MNTLSSTFFRNELKKDKTVIFVLFIKNEEALKVVIWFEKVK